MTGVDLVVTDLDGTLWHTDDDIHPGIAAAWAEITRHVPVLVATGRRTTSTRVPLARVGIVPSAVVLNGALALDLASGHRYHVAPFPAVQASAVLEAFQELGLDPCLYVDDVEAEVLVSETPSTNQGHLESLGDTAAVADLRRAAEVVPVLGFSIIGAEHRLLSAAAAAVEGTAEVHLDRSLDFPGLAAITVAPKGQSKWDGVEAYCHHHGLDATRVLAVGDGPNDVELLTHAAISVVPEVAHPAALELADHLIPSARDAGWLQLPDLLADIAGRAMSAEPPPVPR